MASMGEGAGSASGRGGFGGASAPGHSGPGEGTAPGWYYPKKKKPVAKAVTQAPLAPPPATSKPPAERPPRRPGVNPNLPVDPVQASRGNRRPDRTLLDAVMGQSDAGRSRAGSYRGGVLSAVYRLPADGTRAARTLQQFNGGRGRERLTLGT